MTDKILDEIFVDHFTPKEYRQIDKKNKEWSERKGRYKIMPKKVDIAIEFFRKDKRRDTRDWNLFCHRIGFSYSTFITAFHAIQKERQNISKNSEKEK